MRLRTDLPSRNDVELCIRALEIQDEEDVKAIRAFYERERKLERRPWWKKFVQWQPPLLVRILVEAVALSLLWYVFSVLVYGIN